MNSAVRFDDRLLTVLNQPAAGGHDLAVRWRQLVDLVARAGANAASAGVSRALETIRAEAPKVDESLRAAAARAVSALPLPLGLLEYFASDSLSVSAPVLAAATLEPAEWRAILAGAGKETRRFVEALHPDLRENPGDGAKELIARAPEPFVEEPIRRPFEDLTRALLDPANSVSDSRDQEIAPEATDPLAEEEAAELPSSAAPKEASPSAGDSEPVSTAPSLKELIERIERRRRSRAALIGAAEAAPREEAPLSLFRWECGPGGEIVWVDNGPRGALIGRSIARQQDGGDHIDVSVVRAFTRRAPFRDADLNFAQGLLAGDWKISGVPSFDTRDGRFAGYRGIAFRDHPEAVTSAKSPEILGDPDALRELVHEIKTPLNAIIGFGEMIAGQYLGPAERRYRDRASEIVRQARMLLSAIEELDFAAEVRSSSADRNGPANLDQLVASMMATVREIGAGRGVEIAGFAAGKDETLAATPPKLAERLIFRTLNAVIEDAQAGERLKLSLEQSAGRWRLSISRPAMLAGFSEEQLLGAGADFDKAFPLRLVRGLARIAGADLVAPPETISLLFPRA